MRMRPALARTRPALVRMRPALVRMQPVPGQPTMPRVPRQPILGWEQVQGLALIGALVLVLAAARPPPLQCLPALLILPEEEPLALMNLLEVRRDQTRWRAILLVQGFQLSLRQHC